MVLVFISEQRCRVRYIGFVVCFTRTNRLVSSQQLLMDVKYSKYIYIYIYIDAHIIMFVSKYIYTFMNINIPI